MQSVSQRRVYLLSLILAIGACSPAVNEDEQLRQQVSAVIASATDLPGDSLQVAVENGVVTVSGTLACEDCGGLRTPGGEDTTQQSLGAVVRAVPGVDSVRFALQ